MAAPRILAIETSQREGSLALTEGTQLLTQLPLCAERRTAQSLLPAIQEVIGATGMSLSDLDLIAVSQGPGSFTGLRIGMTTAKTLAYALQTDLIGVHTLEVIAARLFLLEQRVEQDEVLEVVLDAQRQQLFTARFRLDNDVLREEAATAIVDFKDWRESPPGECRRGGVLPPWAAENLAEELPFRFLSQPPDASALALLAAARTAAPSSWPASSASRASGENPLGSPGMAPNYFRQSAAEEKKR